MTPLVEVPEGAFTDLYAVDVGGGNYRHFYLSRVATKMCLSGEQPIVRVRVEKSPREDGPYWGWWSAERQHFTMIYQARMLAEICFTYGSKAEEERGRGRLVPLIVTLLPSLEGDRP